MLDLGPGEGLVAVLARHRQMTSRKGETRFLMTRGRERGAVESLDGVTKLAAVAIGRAGELSAVAVLVTVGASRLADAINSIASIRQMAGGTLQ